MAESVDFISVHMRDRTVSTPTDVASDQLDVDGGSRFDVARSRRSKTGSASAGPALNRSKTERAKERSELLKSGRRSARHKQRRLNPVYRRRACGCAERTRAQQRLRQKQLMQRRAFRKFLKLAINKSGRRLRRQCASSGAGSRRYLSNPPLRSRILLVEQIQ